MPHVKEIVAPSRHVAEILEDATPKVGTIAGKKDWGIYFGNIPNRPSAVIQINDTDVRGTTYPINRPGASERVEYPGIQIIARALEYQTVFSKINQCINAVANIGRFVKDDFQYLEIYKQGGWLYLGEDEKGRHSFSANFMAVRTPTP